MEKMTVRKIEKNWLTYASTKSCVLQYLICMQTNVKYANNRTLLTGSTIPWSNWFYNIVKAIVRPIARTMRFFDEPLSNLIND